MMGQAMANVSTPATQGCISFKLKVQRETEETHGDPATPGREDRRPPQGARRDHRHRRVLDRRARLGSASAYFRGGSVIYTHTARGQLLGIGEALPPEIKRASTEPYATLLADTVRKHLSATWGVGESGATGPTGNMYGDRPGHSCIAISGPVAKVITLETGDKDRVANMRAFAKRVLELLADALEA